jgi:predicted phage gp36 major capsid-like protein
MNAKQRAKEWLKWNEMSIPITGMSKTATDIISDLLKELEQAEAERDRYLEALERIAEGPETINEWAKAAKQGIDMRNHLAGIARAALGGGE